MSLVKAATMRCDDCGAVGPSDASAMAVRRAAKTEGWSRCYRGSGEAHRCPACREGRVEPGCENCSGTGADALGEDCELCEGSGVQRWNFDGTAVES